MFFPPYVPTFTSGWVPPPILSMDAEPHMLAAAIQDQAHHVQRVEEAWKAGGANVSRTLALLLRFCESEKDCKLTFTVRCVLWFAINRLSYLKNVETKRTLAAERPQYAPFIIH